MQKQLNETTGRKGERERGESRTLKPAYLSLVGGVRGIEPGQ